MDRSVDKRERERERIVVLSKYGVVGVVGLGT